MLFEGGTITQDLSYTVLMDTGASANFISPQLLKRLQLECQPADAKLRLADNTEAPILGKVQLRLKIQQFSTVVWCYVTDLCSDFFFFFFFFGWERHLLQRCNESVCQHSSCAGSLQLLLWMAFTNTCGFFHCIFVMNVSPTQKKKKKKKMQ